MSSYIKKCVFKTDSEYNDLKPSRDLIVFIVDENHYIGYTIKDMNRVMATDKTFKVCNDPVRGKKFYYLKYNIVVDSSLQTCMVNKINTMKLIPCEQQSNVPFHYSVEAVERKDIGSDEASTLTESVNPLLIDFISLTVYTGTEEQIGNDALAVLTDKRTIVEKGFMDGLWFHKTIDVQDDIMVVSYFYRNGKQKSETWYKGDVMFREGNKPFYTTFYENDGRIKSCHKHFKGSRIVQIETFE